MTRAPEPIALPEPRRSRWQPLRIGLVDLYYYDVEEFWFRDGHLLLRGNNGTGKSKVLSLTLPFLLDANQSASRVEPDGDRNKHMQWNLLMGGRHERRTGYTWIELGRRDELGQAQTLTLGCGLRAVDGRHSVDAWYFVTDQRIGAELWLTTHDRAALSKERLTEAIGTRGQVFDTAVAYRRAVDERLFRLGTERYAALVDTLIQLRQPQLSKQPDQQRLSDALTEALPPLDRTVLEDVSEAMSQLEDFRRELDELERMSKSVETFSERYQRYAQVAARRRARVVRQSQTEFDNASRELNAAEEELERARAAVTQRLREQQELDEALTSDDARLRVLRADPAMRDAIRIDEARQRMLQFRDNASEAERRVETARARCQEEEILAGQRRDESTGTRAELIEAHRIADSLASRTGVSASHTAALGDTLLKDGALKPDGAVSARDDFIGRFLKEAREGETRRRDQIGVLRKRLHELGIAENARNRAHDLRALHANALDAATESLRHATETLREAIAGTLASWRHHCAILQVLSLADTESVLDALEGWVESMDGPNPMRSALDDARRTHEARVAASAAALGESKRSLLSERKLLLEERTRLEAGVDQPPPVPYTRGAGTRTGIPGAALWQLVDFAPHVSNDARVGLEAALEAAGLLDAWVTPEGVLLDPRTHDVVLMPRARVVSTAAEQSCSASALADWLVATIPDAGCASAVQPDALVALLASIACAEHEQGDAEAWVSPKGEFRIGPARGAWMKPTAQYIGHAAREAARRARLAQMSERLAEIDASIAELDAEADRLSEARRIARSEYESAPSDDDLLRAHATRAASEQQRRAAQERLGEVESRLATAEHALSRARDALDLDARDLNLPKDGVAISELEQTLNAYSIASVKLGNAIRNHRNALAELARQLERQEAMRADLETYVGELTEKRRLLRDAEETLRTLQATVGKRVDELLRDIEAAELARDKHDRALKDARAKLNVASVHRGTAEQKREDSDARLQERLHARRQAIEGMQEFADVTGLLVIALPGISLPDAEAAWGVDAALTVARRTEQALVEVPADDDAWHRIQNAISRDLTELQSAMSAQGHSATAEYSDYGVIVRIVHQQRPERPDTLRQQLDAELAERRLILSAQERAVLENHLQKEIAASLQRMIQDTERQVAAINIELHKRPTSTGVRYRLDWHVLPEDAAQSGLGLTEARKRLLKTSADAWSSDDRRLVGEFLQTRIASERSRDDQATLFESLARALDYRRWHRFRVLRLQDGAWKPLAGPASSGERALGLTVPLFAAASSHYESADANAPRLVLLDEAFAGIDDEARANCMALIREFDLDFVMTSEREWGCYRELPGLSICQLVRREGIDGVFVSRWTWDGSTRRQEEDPVRRFPDAAVAASPTP